MQVHSVYTTAVVAMIAVALLAKVVLLRRPHWDERLLRDPRDAAIYAVSKLAPVLAIAFAVAADASGGTSATNAMVGAAGLLIVSAITAWTVYARLSGRFFGWAHMLRGG